MTESFCLGGNKNYVSEFSYFNSFDYIYGKRPALFKKGNAEPGDDRHFSQ